MAKIVGVDYEDGAIKEIHVTTDGENRVRFKPIVDGRWMANKEGHLRYLCSVCGSEKPLLGHMEYCGHCGANMDEEIQNG